MYGLGMWQPRGYLGAGIGYPYYGGIGCGYGYGCGYPYYGYGYPGYGAFYGSPYYR